MNFAHTSAGQEMAALHLEFYTRATQILREAGTQPVDPRSAPEVLGALAFHAAYAHALAMVLCRVLYAGLPHAETEMETLIRTASGQVALSITPPMARPQ